MVYKNPNYQKEYYEKNKDKIKKTNKKNYLKVRDTEEFKETKRKAQKKYYEKHKEEIIKRKRGNRTEKDRARDKAINHIKIPKNQLCEVCKLNKATERHHEDYRKPLRVKFVCRSCNRKLERK